MAETGSKFLPSTRGDSAYLLQRWIPNGYGVNLNSRLCFDFGTATENASKSTSYTHKVRKMRVPEIEQNLLCAGHKGHLRHRIYCESKRIFRFRRKGHIVRRQSYLGCSWLITLWFVSKPPVCYFTCLIIPLTKTYCRKEAPPSVKWEPVLYSG